MLCAYNICLKLVSNSESDYARIQIRSTEYTKTKEGFEIKKEAFKYYNDEFLKIQHLYD